MNNGYRISKERRIYVIAWSQGCFNDLVEKHLAGSAYGRVVPFLVTNDADALKLRELDKNSLILIHHEYRSYTELGYKIVVGLIKGLGIQRVKGSDLVEAGIFKDSKTKGER